MQEKYGFVYIWRDKKHNRYYIGSHWGTEDDGYICSSTNMRNNYNNRPFDFKRRIISRITTNRKDLLQEEEKWLNKIPCREMNRRYYNKTKCARGPLDIKELSRISKALHQDPEYRKKFLEGRKIAREKNKGKKRSSEIKEKISKAKLKKFQEKRDNNISCFSEEAYENLKNARLKRRGTKLSEEHKMKIGQSSQALWQTDKYRNNVSEGLKSVWESRTEEEKIEIAKKISESLKGKKNRLGQKNSPEHIEKIRQKNIGKKRSPEQIEKMRQSKIGKKYTEEQKRKRSEMTKLWWKERKEKLNASTT